MTTATSCIWKCTFSSASTAATSPASVGIQCSFSGFRSSAVSTAMTPGTFSASDLSIFLMRPWAMELRTMSMCTMPGSLMSST